MSEGDNDDATQQSIFHPKNKLRLTSSVTKEAKSEEDDNETAIAVSLMTGNSDINTEADFRSSGRSVSSSSYKGSIFGKLRSGSAGTAAEYDDQNVDSYSDSSGGSYKRYSVWTK